ncbi:calcium:proton antiporter [Sphingobacterium mizutaii NBRC 14946 = DSM 11724]|uniref:Calcium/proton antiporter n=4 Tax=Sphingobacterium mizutaii TaxID=1010 RepID=A0AAJ5C166_9SPHI|nr:calcium:proton antiporter [Sphingobacterium mizutaii]GEM69620.1 calcium:proton antiporter [Sphingobacterium mizutaii NBRC 14946 = DSM 11724]SDL25240.1 Ca2+:H+ antiporter [Sphingobacterium mizutaii]SNV53185.1 Calcium/proton antiporter [Sphingobacterium mizutaii]
MNNILTKNTIIRLILIWLMVFIFMFFGKSIEGLYSNNGLAIGIFLLVLATIIGAAFGVVKEADELAHKLGEPYGTLILTLSIVSIEVILIVAMMFGPEDNPTIGKDSIFSVMMIIMNLVLGLCILLGGLRHGEQEYNAQGTITYLSMIIMLGGISMMIPNFIEGKGNGEFTSIQAASISGLIILLYGFFLAYQMKGYRHLYIQPKPGQMEILFAQRNEIQQSEEHGQEKVSKKEVLLRTIILLGMILPIVLLSHNLATLVDYGIKEMNLPPLLGGVLIAIIVFTPESMTAVKAAMNNEFQRAINLCHGAFVSTVGLTVPSVLIIGLIASKTVLFGMTTTETILFVITLILSMLSFSGRRTAPIVGIMHLVLFAVFVILIFNP